MPLTLPQAERLAFVAALLTALLVLPAHLREVGARASPPPGPDRAVDYCPSGRFDAQGQGWFAPCPDDRQWDA